MGAVDDWNARQRKIKEQREIDEVRLNPHQFGDQLTLFDAPLGQPSAGTFQGNPNARMYRAVGTHGPSMGVERQDFGYETGPDFLQRVQDSVSRPRKDAGHNINLGIHWQHSLPYAHDYANDLDEGGVHGSQNFPVILEADHPGLEHVIDRSTDWKKGRDTAGTLGMRPVVPKELGNNPDSRVVPRNKLTGHAKDWALINDTVGPHDMDAWMVPEVPVRPGAPMRVHAIHVPDPENRGSYIRNPVQFDGFA